MSTTKDKDVAVKGIDLSKIMYQDELKGSDFSDYIYIIEGEVIDKEAHVWQRQNGLQWNDLYDFEAYKVSAIRKERYRGVQGTPVDVVGIKFEKEKALRTVRITVKDALTLNAQLPADDGRIFTTYYLLKKDAEGFANKIVVKRQ